MIRTVRLIFLKEELFVTFEEVWVSVTAFLAETGWRIFEVLAVLVLGVIVIKIILRLLKAAFLKSPVDNSVSGFILSVLRVVFYVVLAFIVANMMNIPLTSFVAIVSAVGLAVGLALQDSLANLANGVVIIGTKPFREGDLVQIGSVTGKVKSIRMLTVELITTDNRKVVLPNSEVTSSTVINHSARPTRRIEWVFGVSYDSDIDEVMSVIRQCLSENTAILREPEPFVRLQEQAASSLNFLVRAWVNTEDRDEAYYDIMEAVFRAFGEHRIEIPYNKLDVRVLSVRPEDGKEQ